MPCRLKRFAALWTAFGLLCCAGLQAWAAQLVKGPEIELDATSAVIRWVTDSPTGTRVRIAPSGPTVTVTEGLQPGTRHAATLSDLRPGVSYTVIVGTARVSLATNTFTLGLAPASSPVAPQIKSPAASVQPSGSDKAVPVLRTWGNPASLRDHFDRHGPDFSAKNPDDYARMAADFLRRAKTDGLPAKMDSDGVLRVFDPKTRAFGAYNADGTTRTFFKPRSRDYFERQPGKSVNLKTWK